MDPVLVGQLQALLDQYGWANLLVALDAVARSDGFLPLADALDPIHHLVHHNGENHRRGPDGAPQVEASFRAISKSLHRLEPRCTLLAARRADGLLTDRTTILHH